MTIYDHALQGVQQVRSDIAPGASGWELPGGDEVNALREVIKRALTTLEWDIQTNYANSLCNLMYDTITNNLPGQGVGGEREANANRGQMNAALGAAENELQDIVDANPD